MGKQYRQRPSQLVGVSDSYAAYCLDEAVYFYGTYVESELHNAVKGITDDKDGKKAEQKHRQTLHMLLSQDDIPENPQETGVNSGYVHDPDDPVSYETAKTLPAPVRFRDREFADPAKLFVKKE